ncbi:cell division protein ZipA [Shewanella xiamenensis]|uniref:cell division protein ZipA n=1 Tax=Shewanella xiamenensis TaxID=332186 RepID=UPI0011848D05|nr:cell division protein ZipA [Shewanella xiamenensis]TVL16212.1 cell division protein ZipA [Shewanella xiamenensis]TVL16282.1 cell division protein ZipA [Shewanella xiamenensis]TVL24095.1 cell division protein ZipA [Shewanella xiamenensis]TVL30315.1 cell division protein ZipA [Shewanella xiamenensis]TVO99367.1 cell division protein ZipA [Shewanella xiamenensis]
MEDLQLVLFVLGAIAIVAVLVHGFWSIRRQQPKSLKDSPMGNFYKKQAERGEAAPKRIDADGFDADGIGAVRVRKANEAHTPEAPAFNPYLKQEAKAQPQPVEPVQVEPKPLFKQEPSMAQPDFNLQSPSVKEQHRGPKASRQEPVLQSHTAHLNQAHVGQSHAAIVAQKAAEEQRAQVQMPTQTALFDDEDAYEEEQPQAVEQADDDLGEPRDVLVLHVVAKEGQQLNGAELLPCFLTLNFKYGDMNIFHRHVDNAGNGKVLFSIANMVKPGVFDPDNMEQFSTQGVVFFMTLPCYGDALMNFSIMLNSARQLADDIDAVVLDGQRQPWGEFTKQDYLHRIRANA